MLSTSLAILRVIAEGGVFTMKPMPVGYGGLLARLPPAVTRRPSAERKEKEKEKKRKEKKRKEKKRKEKKRKEKAFWGQFHEKPSVIPGCPGLT